ncbi:MAG: asparagine synthase C-terminal domain-containing protein, partial [Thermoleophilia bacterium]|nr:asparagine synthase C-terminal domain-containing protein [Thermoleophilia bacterium]
SGDGGDEAFAGYERYAAMGLAETIGRAPLLPAAGGRLLRALPSGRREPRATSFRAARLLETASRPESERYGALVEVFSPKLRSELYSPELAGDLGQPRSAASLLGPPPYEGVSGLQALDARTYLADDLLVKSDRASMAASLELRSPLLDHEVVELGLSLPDSLKLDGRRGKVALRRAFADLLPREIADRRKTGFGVPLGTWLRGPLRDVAGDLLLDERARTRGRFRAGVVERLLTDHARGKRDHGHRLWCLLVLELWQRTWLEGSAVPEPALGAST